MAGKCDPGATITCPTNKQYSDEFMDAAATEYEAAEKMFPHLVRLVDDYGIQRDVIRACIAKRDKAKKKK